MKKILMLAAANIRRGKSQAVSLLIFVLISTMFLDIGLVLFIDYGKSFDDRAEELNAPHTVIVQSVDFTTDEQLAFLEKYPHVTEFEKQDVIAGLGEYYLKGGKATASIIFSTADERKSMNSQSLIGDSYQLDENSIYVPYLMKMTGGYELGDDFKVIFMGKELHFKIAGFSEEFMFGASMINIYRFYIDDEMYTKLSQTFTGNSCYLLSVRMTKSRLGLQAETDYAKEFFYSDGAGEIFTSSINIDIVKEARTFIPTLTALMVIGFSLILLVVSLIVIRSGIVNNIEESMANIGVLKAMGYKSWQIVFSILLQFSGLTVIGGVLGVAASRLVLPILSQVLESQSALIWSPNINVFLAATALCCVLGTVLLVTYMATRRIKKLHPLIALRGGLKTHSFKKNYVPLDKTNGALSFLLALKQLLHNKKQMFMIAMIIAVVTFASVTALSLYYNTGVEKDAFASAVVGEIPDVMFALKGSSYSQGLKERISARQDVRKAYYNQSISQMVNEIEVLSTISDDFSKYEGKMLYDGRYPKHFNEVAIGNNLSKATGKKIGDRITVTQNGQSKDFLITGIMQSFMNSGMTILMTYDGVLSLQSDFAFSEIYAYLHTGIAANDFIESVVAAEGDIFNATIDAKELLEAQLGSYGSIFAAISAVILVVTVVVVVLVLYMVIKTMILRRKREFGIQKAVGFTTLQLMNQIALNYTPMIFIGVVLGGITGYFSLNPLFAALTSSGGIVSVDMPSPLSWTIITCSVLVILAYLISMLVSWRIRKISAYALVSE